MCSSKDPLWTDERTATEICIINYESNLPRKLSAGCNDTTGDKLGLFIQGHMDFSSEFYIVHKQISMQQQKKYVTADNNIFDNY